MQANADLTEPQENPPAASKPASKAKTIGVWVVCGLLALQYLFAGATKLFGTAQAVEGFHHAGFSDGFRIFIGAAETSGALGLLAPRLRFWASIGLSLVMLGALHTHVRAGDSVGKMMPAGISLVLLIAMAIVSRPRRA